MIDNSAIVIYAPGNRFISSSENCLHRVDFQPTVFVLYMHDRLNWILVLFSMIDWHSHDNYIRGFRFAHVCIFVEKSWFSFIMQYIKMNMNHE